MTLMPIQKDIIKASLFLTKNRIWPKRRRVFLPFVKPCLNRVGPGKYAILRHWIYVQMPFAKLVAMQIQCMLLPKNTNIS